MAYILIDGADYATLTGRDASECTEAREKLACAIVDSMLGRNTIEDTTWLTNQTEALEYAVAMTVKFLYINSDAPPDTKGFRLGKYETKGTGTISMSDLYFAYLGLKKNACINLKAYFGGFDTADYV